jgi:DNA-binding MarR family transcriptional regulator
MHDNLLATPAPWPQHHLSDWMRLALERFDARVMALVAHHPGVPLGLAHLAGRGQVGAAQLHITRHLPEAGARLTDLAARAGMTKQAMGALVTQCEAWGMVTREPHPGDARARSVQFTPAGLAWLAAYQDAVRQTEAEMRAAIGGEVTTVIALGLEAYSGT